MRPAKAFACVIRRALGGAEILVFTHPDGVLQIPKGGIDPGESASDAALRELLEETGIHEVAGASVIGTHSWPGDEEHAAETWHFVRLEPTADLSDRWDHQVTGEGLDTGMVFRCGWVPLAFARDLCHPLFAPCIDALRAAPIHEL